jgi:hypothetical protein
MAHSKQRNMADKILIQLIEADVEIGFGLVDEANAFRASGNPEFRWRALQDVQEVIADIERRLERLGACESVPFHPLVTELRREVAAAEQAAA